LRDAQARLRKVDTVSACLVGFDTTLSWQSEWGSVVLEVSVKRSADSLLRELERRGLVVKLDTVEAQRNARHWHLGFDKQPGVLEITDLGDTCELKVADNRDGGWATALVSELAKPRRRSSS
jgi:hypothetical protein